MISFQESVETLFTGIFGCGRSCNYPDFSDYSDCKENQNDVQIRFSSKPEKYLNSSIMITNEKNCSILNETATTCQDSFLNESTSSLDNNGSVVIARLPLQPQQEPPRVRLHKRELVAIPPGGSMKSWSPVMPHSVLADPVFVSKKEHQRARMPIISPMAPPKIQRLTLDDAQAFSGHPRRQRHDNRTPSTATSRNNSEGMMYDIDGLPVEVPEAFSRSRSLDFLFSFPSVSHKENGPLGDLCIVEACDRYRDADRASYPSSWHYQKRGMVEDTSAYPYPHKTRKQDESILSHLNSTHITL